MNTGKNNFKHFIRLLLELGKVRITSFVTVSAAAGYIFWNKTIDLSILAPLVGVFLLACGSSALNHYQERKTDALMKRTALRPLPSGRISPGGALGVVISFIIIGLALLYISGGLQTVLLGMLAVFWYNVVYTPLKKVTALAVIPGALIGAIPPVIGWASAGGNIFDPKVLSLALFFFIWQIPHFWLLLLIYDKQYKEAGFPTLLQKFSYRQSIRLTYIWVAILGIAAFLLPVTGLTNYLFTDILLIAAGLKFIWKVRKMYEIPANKLRFAFMELNIFVLTVIVLISLDNLLKF